MAATTATLTDRYAGSIQQSLTKLGDRRAAAALKAHDGAKERLAGPAHAMSGGFDRFSASRLTGEAQEYLLHIYLAEALQNLGHAVKGKSTEDYLRFLRSYYQQELSRVLDGAKRGEDIRAEAQIIAALREAESDAWYELMQRKNSHLEGTKLLLQKMNDEIRHAEKAMGRMRSASRIAEAAAKVEELKADRETLKAEIGRLDHAWESELALRHKIRRVTLPSGYVERMIHGNEEERF